MKPDEAADVSPGFLCNSLLINTKEPQHSIYAVLAERRELIMSHDLTALYERLSHDNELQGESNSISNQDGQAPYGRKDIAA